MTASIVEEKIKELPEAYIALVDKYVDQLLEKKRKIDVLRGIFSESANENLRSQEKDAWKKAAMEKHLNG